MQSLSTPTRHQLDRLLTASLSIPATRLNVSIRRAMSNDAQQSALTFELNARC